MELEKSWCSGCGRYVEDCFCPKLWEIQTPSNSLREHQSKAGKSRMSRLTKEQRIELARKAGIASGQSRVRANKNTIITNTQKIPAA